MRWALIIKGTNRNGGFTYTRYYDEMTEREARSAFHFYARNPDVEEVTLVDLESAVLVDTGA